MVLPYNGVSRSEAFALADWYAQHDGQPNLPAEALAIGYRWYAWHQPAGYRSLRLKACTYRLHVPAMVFLVLRGKAFVHALCSDRRPDEQTQLYVAPFPGLGRRGLIPQWRPPHGDLRIDACMNDVIQVFDHSALMSADNGWEPQSKHPMGVEKLWVEMIQRRWKRFPYKYLSRSPYTLGGLLEKVRNGDLFEVWPEKRCSCERSQY